MNRYISSAVAVAVQVTDNSITVVLLDGRELSIPTAWSERLASASTEQRDEYEIAPDGLVIAWPAIDEHIGVWTFLGVAEDSMLEAANQTSQMPEELPSSSLEPPSTSPELSSASLDKASRDADPIVRLAALFLTIWPSDLNLRPTQETALRVAESLIACGVALPVMDDSRTTADAGFGGPFSAPPDNPDCTHRIVSSYQTRAAGQPVAFWTCARCGRRFIPKPAER